MPEGFKVSVLGKDSAEQTGCIHFAYAELPDGKRESQKTASITGTGDLPRYCEKASGHAI